MSSAQRSPALKWQGAPQCVPECSPIVILLSRKPSFSTVKSVSSSKSGSPGKIGIPTVFTWLRKTTLLNPNGPLCRPWADADCGLAAGEDEPRPCGDRRDRGEQSDARDPAHESLLVSVARVYQRARRQVNACR